MDLRDYMTDQGIEARYASADELGKAAEKVEDPRVRDRLLTAAALKELLESRDQDIVDGLIGRLGADYLDDVTIVLEMTAQGAMEEELFRGNLCRRSPQADITDLEE